MKIEPPKIDERKPSGILTELKGLIPYYTPEWRSFDEQEPGIALLKIFAHLTGSVIERLNQTPSKNFIAFLEMLGIKLLPAQPAKVPLTFQLAEGTGKDIWIPAKTQAAADKSAEHDELPFETEKNLLATTSRLTEVIGVDPFQDSIYVYTPRVIAADGKMLEKQEPFTVFAGLDLQEHSLYLGHTDLLNMEGPGNITLEICAVSGNTLENSGLNFLWEYWGENPAEQKDEWIQFQVEPVKQKSPSYSETLRLIKTGAGKIKEEKLGEIFNKTGHIAIQNEEIDTLTSRWIRCRLNEGLNPDSPGKLPSVGSILIGTCPKDSVPPDAGFFNDVPIDWAPVTLETKIIYAQTSSGCQIYVDSVEGFNTDDIVEITREGKVIFNNLTINEIKIFPETFPQKKVIDFKKCPCVHPDCSGPVILPEDGLRLSKKINKVFPFGKQPRFYDTFYIGSQEVFSKKGAKITLYFSLSHVDTLDKLVPDPVLSWEYWNGKGWLVISLLKDETGRFLVAEDEKKVEFPCPGDIEETEVNGQKNYWTRVRIVGGEYGRVDYISRGQTEGVGLKSQYKLPCIRDLKLQYTYEIKKEPQHCLTYNNLDFQVKSAGIKAKEQRFQPFYPLDDNLRNLYLGFDRPFTGGPLRIFFNAKELPYSDKDKPRMVWNYRNETGWALLDCKDETDGLIARGHLEFIGPEDLARYTLFGRNLYWIQASLTQGVYESLPELRGIYPNTTWAIQAGTVKDEILGSGNGRPDQSFTFAKVPVLEGEEVRVREILSEEEKQTPVETASGEDAIIEIRDDKGKVTETWVRWSEVPDFFDSNPESRHYTLDRATGQLDFGDGVKGMIPPAGDNNIKAFSYQTGGGARGNVKTGEIKTMKSAVAGVEKVSNPAAADGGADTATMDRMLELGPALISHGNRAVTLEDFEWLAQLASRKVAKVKCLPNRKNQKETEIGWVSVIIVPGSPEAKPFPSLELRRQVRNYLEAHAANQLTAAKHIYVDGPTYVEVAVSVDVYVVSMDNVSQVERDIRSGLNAFFHPLTGGPEGKGWDFGRPVAASDVYALLENNPMVDHVENMLFHHEGTVDTMVRVEPDALVATGVHEINLQLVKGAIVL